MLKRTWHLFRARFAMAHRSGWPIPALVFHAGAAALLALLVRELLPAYPHVLLALSTGALLLVMPLLSDLGAILRVDEGAEWIGSLPARPAERTLARTLHLLMLLGALALAWFVPWAVFAPDDLGLTARLALPGLGFTLVLALATLLIWVQQLLLVRLEAAFVLLETAWMTVAVVALVQLLGHLPELAMLAPGHASLAWFPPAWFARALVEGGSACWIPMGSGAACLAALLAVPAGGPRRVRRRAGIERWLTPLLWIARRFWVRPDERGTFDLVYSALPREREFALRTYPMLGIPLAFLWIGASGRHAEDSPWRSDLLALLLFTTGVALPLLLTHVPLTESPQAAWIQRTAPCPNSARIGGAIKAVFVRWMLPLDLALLGLGLVLSEANQLARLWLPASLLGLILLRFLYPRCVRDLPLSTAPEDLRSDLDWAGLVATLAVGLTILAVLANRHLGPAGGLGLALGLLLWENGLERRLRRA